MIGNKGPNSLSDSFGVLQCYGWYTLSVRQEHWFSEWSETDQDEYGRMAMRPGLKEVCYPAPAERAKPELSDTIADEVLRDALGELYAALNAGLNMLASLRALTLLDRAGYLLIGDPRGRFEGKLSALQTGGPHQRIGEDDAVGVGGRGECLGASRLHTDRSCTSGISSTSSGTSSIAHSSLPA